MNKELAISTPINELQIMSEAVYSSGMFGLKSQNQALTLMMIAEADGIPAVKALQQYSIIQGLPALKSTEVHARFQRAGGKVVWLENSDDKVVCRLSHEEHGEIEITWTMDRAKKAGFAIGKENKLKDNWAKMPQQMMRARCVSEGVRAIYPACLNNMYSVDEVEDMPIQHTKDNPHALPSMPVTNDVIEADIEPNINDLKSKLSKQLRELDFNSDDIKKFALKFDLAEDMVAIDSLINDKKLLMKKVTEFENGETK